MAITRFLLAAAMAVSSAVSMAAAMAAATATTSSARPGPEIRISDVQLFYRIYDAAGGTPSADSLQHEYIEGGTDGVRQFISHRIVSAEALAKKIAGNRAPYEKARACLAVLPAVQSRLSTVLPKLGALLPDARFPPVTILIGRANTGGTTGNAGVLIGLETICNADWLEPRLEDRLVHLISHEYVHVQQPMVQRDGDDEVKHTVLESTLTEGVADFVGELISGSVANTQLQQWLAGCDEKLAADFMKEIDSTDSSHWLYNGVGTREKPGDMGYWVGYRIAQKYYDRSNNKTRAVQRLVRLDDPKAILAASGWANPLKAPAQRAGQVTCKLGADYFPSKVP